MFPIISQVSKENFKMLLKYIEDMKGKSRSVTLENAQKIIEDDTGQDYFYIVFFFTIFIELNLFGTKQEQYLNLIGCLLIILMFLHFFRCCAQEKLKRFHLSVWMGTENSINQSDSQNHNYPLRSILFLSGNSPVFCHSYFHKTRLTVIVIGQVFWHIHT